MKEKKQCCILFNTCGAYIIQEWIRNINRIAGCKIDKKKWSKRFCFSNPENCIHFGYKKGA